MGYFPNSISGRNKGGASSQPDAVRSSQPAASYKLQHNWPQLVVLALGIHRRFGLFGRAGENVADMSSLLNSLYNVEDRPRRPRRREHKNNIIIPTASDNRARRTNKFERRPPGSSYNPQPLQCVHSLLFSYALSRHIFPSASLSCPSRRLVSFVPLTHMHIHTVCCTWPCNKLVRAAEC